jgi:hypothetical protein
MSENFPEFETDDELEAWFETADLSVHDLERALEVMMSSRIGLILEEPWTAADSAASSTTTSGRIEPRELAGA